MGGDFAPEVAVEGAVMALKKVGKDSRIVLFGDKERILELLKKHKCSAENFDIVGTTEVIAFVPMSEMFGYATDMRSKSQGRAQYSMEPSHFAEVPKSIQEGIISARAKN